MPRDWHKINIMGARVWPSKSGHEVQDKAVGVKAEATAAQGQETYRCTQSHARRLNSQ